MDWFGRGAACGCPGEGGAVWAALHCRLGAPAECQGADLQRIYLLPSLEALGWVHMLVVQQIKHLWGLCVLLLYPRIQQGSCCPCKCSGSWEGELVAGEQSWLAGVGSDHVSAASFSISEHKCMVCVWGSLGWRVSCCFTAWNLLGKSKPSLKIAAKSQWRKDLHIHMYIIFI